MMTFSGESPAQVESELNSFISIIVESGALSYLEVGSGRGDSFHAIVSAMPPGSRAVSVDFPENKWGFVGGRRHLLLAIEDLRAKGYDVDLIEGDSQDKSVIERAGASAPFDVVFIDGDHSYDGAKSDWLNYGQLGKIVGFHDIAYEKNETHPWGGVEVKRLWQEIREGHRYQEFIEVEGNMGIGVIWNAN